MSFSKAKLTRFNDIPTGSAPDCIYDPKVDMKLPGGLIDKKVPRFLENAEGTPGGSIKSETGSVRSSKSTQLFRTPSIRRQFLNRFTQNRVKPKAETPGFDEETKEILWANRVEILNKDETIAEQEKLIEDQKEEIVKLSKKTEILQEEVDSLKREQDLLRNDLQSNIDIKNKERIEFEEIVDKFTSLVDVEDNMENQDEFKTIKDKFEVTYNNLVKYFAQNMQEKMNLKVDLRILTQKLEDSEGNLKEMKTEFDFLRINFQQKEKSLIKLNEDMQFDLLVEKKKHDDELNKIRQDSALKLEYMNEMHDMKIKELESCREIEKRQIISEYTEKINALDKDLRAEIDMIQQTAVEKVQLAELTAEEKCKMLEITTKDELVKEKERWQSEFDKCQKIAETEIMQSEFEKLDLQSLVNLKNSELDKEINEKSVLQKNIEEKDTEILDLIRRLNRMMEEHDQYKIKIEENLMNVQEDYKKSCQERFKYEITLKGTREALDILSERLKSSDNDVEILKKELADLTTRKMDTDKANINHRAELAVLQSLLIEYKVMLSNLTMSSKLLLEKNNVLTQNTDFFKIIEQMELDTEDKIRSVNDALIAKVDKLKLEADAEKQKLILENENYKRQIHESEKQIDEIYDTLRVIDGVLGRMEISIVEKEEMLENMHEKISTLENQLEDQTDEIMRLENENLFMKDAMNNCTGKFRDRDDTIDNLECELYNVREEFAIYKENMDEKLLELEEMECASAKRENELQDKVDEQKLRITDLEAQFEEAMSLIGPFRTQLENYEFERQALESQRERATDDAREISKKYAELLGHQNHKQKIKYVVKLKQQNCDLIEENQKLQLQITRQKATIDKLQKQSSCINSVPITPSPGAKSNRNAQRIPKTPSQDIENILSPKFNRDSKPRHALGLSPILKDANKRE